MKCNCNCPVDVTIFLYLQYVHRIPCSFSVALLAKTIVLLIMLCITKLYLYYILLYDMN